MRIPQFSKLFACVVFLFSSSASHSQLVECQLASVEPAAVPNGCVAKSLDDQIGSGHGDSETAGSAVYLVKRDPARPIRRGRQLFQRKFSFEEGLGPRVNMTSPGNIVDSRALGAGLTDSCAACHGRPKGSAGFGGDVATRPDSRDAPHLFGLGLVEQLADEMTFSLRAKGVDFGELTADPNGSVDTDEVEGIDKDLRIRPFFHHGQTASIREFIIGAFKDEMGMQAWDPVLCQVTDPINPRAATSPSGFIYDPATDNYERPPVCDDLSDADLDGISAEVDPALVDHMEFYLLNYFKPGRYQISRAVRRGAQVMDDIGCTNCHTQNLNIASDRRVADVETIYDPVNGIFNDLFATASTRFDVVDDGGEYPLLLPQEEPFLVESIYSDLKRHDLGPAFYEREYDGTLVTEFVTEPLWGVGSTAPYGHDGRSINLDSVIRRHGGQAQRSKQRYERLGNTGRQQIITFLQSLVLFPPDDTASNLNPGTPGSNSDIQDPVSHGSINLGELFQIPQEGAE